MESLYIRVSEWEGPLIMACTILPDTTIGLVRHDSTIPSNRVNVSRTPPPLPFPDNIAFMNVGMSTRCFNLTHLEPVDTRVSNVFHWLPKTIQA